MDRTENKKQLIIKNSPYLWIIAICFGVISWGAMIYMGCSNADKADIPLSIAYVLTGAVLFAICLWEAFTAARTVTLTQEGCEIRAWAYRRFHTWDQLWFRKWHEYGDRYLGLRLKKWDRGYVWMSLSPVDLPKRPRSERDQMLEGIDPLSRIRIHIVEADRVGDVFHGLRVERSQFLHFIDSIGLKIQDIDMIR